MRSVACLLWLLLLAGGCVLENQPVDSPDGGTGGTGGNACGSCPPETPACDADSRTCVVCTTDDTRACMGATPVCDPENNACVRCVTNAQCPDPDAARCEDNECKGCLTSTDCEGFQDLPACNAGECVQCIPQTEASNCNGTSCNPATFTCTTTRLNSRETCETCVSDSDCAEPDDRCVEMFYQGERFPDEETGFCLTESSASCQQPFSIPLIARPSLSGPPSQDYCGINEALATCEAVRALVDNQRCENGDDAECPQPSGLCRRVGVLDDRCTYACSGDAQCDNPPNPGSNCGDGGSGGQLYCGGQ